MKPSCLSLLTTTDTCGFEIPSLFWSSLRVARRLTARMVSLEYKSDVKVGGIGVDLIAFISCSLFRFFSHNLSQYTWDVFRCKLLFYEHDIDRNRRKLNTSTCFSARIVLPFSMIIKGGSTPIARVYDKTPPFKPQRFGKRPGLAIIFYSGTCLCLKS